VVIDARRRIRPTVGWDQLPEARHPSSEPELEAAVLEQEAIAQLHSLIAALDAEQRELVLLRFMAGLTVPEIAVVQGKGQSTIHRHLAQALQRLREGYDER